MAIMSRQLRERIQGRFIPPENYHITLAFIGETLEMSIPLTIDAIDEATKNLDGILLKPDQLGKFGRSEDATLWLGFAENPELSALAAHIRESLYDYGIVYDHKPFRAHATIARRAKLPKGALPPFSFPGSCTSLAVTLSRGRRKARPISFAIKKPAANIVGQPTVAHLTLSLRQSAAWSIKEADSAKTK